MVADPPSSAPEPTSLDLLDQTVDEPDPSPGLCGGEPYLDLEGETSLATRLGEADDLVGHDPELVFRIVFCREAGGRILPPGCLGV